MPVQSDRIEFAPPPQKGLVRGFALALLAHALLLAALTFGLHWKRDAENEAVEAELWSSTVQQAAPRPVDTPPPPTPEPTTARVQQTAPTPQVKNADIAIERDRQKREQERKERDARELLKKQQAEKAAREKKAAAEKQAAERRKQDEAQRQDDKQAKAAEEKRRLDNIRRMQGLAGATGAPNAAGNAQQSSGPSGSYGDRIKASVKPNITFTDDVAGNPTAEVQVQLAPSGLILARRLIKPSGNAAWDDAVLRALDKTEKLPRDIDGRVFSPMTLTFKRFD